MDSENLVTLTADIVAAHVSNNSVPISDVATLVRQVHGALAGLQAEPTAEPEKPQSAVSARASIKPDYLVCLVCGRKQKTLKRHLANAHDLSPAEYRARFGLKQDYPMSAPNYSKLRGDMARKIGLGQKGRASKPGDSKAQAKRTRKRRAKVESDTT
jgi:predicted transcriptional regulator